MPSSKSCDVYLWLDDNRPFYVGIGPKSRSLCRKHNKQAEGRRRMSESRGTFKIDYVFTGSRPSCESVEQHLIYCYGSVTTGGLLFNFTPGGDGLKGKEFLTESSLQRMVEGGRKGGYASKPTKKVHVLGGQAQGRKNADSGHLRRLSDANAKEWQFTDPNGHLITCRNLSKFCKDNNLNSGGMKRVFLGTQAQHRGYSYHGN